MRQRAQPRHALTQQPAVVQPLYFHFTKLYCGLNVCVVGYVAQDLLCVGAKDGLKGV